MATATTDGRARLVLFAQGIVAMVFGLAVLIGQQSTLRTLLSLVGAYLVVSGVLAFVAASNHVENHTNGWPDIAKGVFGVLAGAVILLVPHLIGTLLLFVVAIWAVATAIILLLAGSTRSDKLEWGRVTVLIVFALALILIATTSATTPVLVIGVFALVYGGLTLARALHAETATSG